MGRKSPIYHIMSGAGARGNKKFWFINVVDLRTGESVVWEEVPTLTKLDERLKVLKEKYYTPEEEKEAFLKSTLSSAS